MKKLNSVIYFVVAVAVLCTGATTVKAGLNDQEPQNLSITQKDFLNVVQDKNKDFLFRYTAIEVLRSNIHNDGQSHDQVKSALINVLQNSKEVYQIRILAALTLMEHGSEEAFNVLKNQAKNEKHRTVRSVLNGIVDKMENEIMLAHNY